MSFLPEVFQSVPVTATGTQSIASTSFATVGSSGTGATPMSATLTTRGGTYLKVTSNVTWSNSSNGGNNITSFQAILDATTTNPSGGGAADGGTLALANAPQNTAWTSVFGPLAAGSHTVALQWKCSNAATTTRCNVGTNNEGGYLLVEEVRVP